jgi:hypothetical protein
MPGFNLYVNASEQVTIDFLINGHSNLQFTVSTQQHTTQAGKIIKIWAYGWVFTLYFHLAKVIPYNSL